MKLSCQQKVIEGTVAVERVVEGPVVEGSANEKMVVEGTVNKKTMFGWFFFFFFFFFVSVVWPIADLNGFGFNALNTIF